MTNQETSHTGTTIVLKGKPTPLLVRVFLTILVAICTLIPIIATIWVISSRRDPHIVLLISYLLFWGSGFYLLRVLIWNTYGREILTLGEDEITYVADFKYFKDGKKAIGINGLAADIIADPDNPQTRGRLLFSNSSEKLETVSKINLPQLSEVIVQLNSHYGIIQSSTDPKS